jgi:hypothetical protein
MEKEVTEYENLVDFFEDGFGMLAEMMDKAIAERNEMDSCLDMENCCD